MIYHRRPWDAGRSVDPDNGVLVGPTDATILQLESPSLAYGIDGAQLPGVKLGGAELYECRLPLGSHSALKNGGIPARPAIGKAPASPEEVTADLAMRRLEQTLARVHELQIANDDPINLWDRLSDFWRDAEHDDKPLVTEIVHQSKSMPRHLRNILERLRRVLRRKPAMVPLDRVQEMDQGSMIWLTRQPGTSLAERAGPSQRIQAIVREESYDTGENRVVHAWCGLAHAAARDWLRHNARSMNSMRYATVLQFSRIVRTARRDLEELGVRIAPEDQLPNFVLTQDPDYREIYEAWRRLLNDKKRLDELWAWQGRTWSDFCALAVTLAVRSTEGSRLVASSPILMFEAHDQGAWFAADRPLAIYFLEKQRLAVEIQYRPALVNTIQKPLAAPIWLKIGSLDEEQKFRRIPVWPRMVFEEVDLLREATNCADAISSFSRKANIQRALIIHSDPAQGAVHAGTDVKATAIGIGPAREALTDGFKHISSLIAEEITEREHSS